MTESAVGFIGIGTMGSRILANVARTGIPIVGWARSPDRVEGLPVQLVDSPREVAARCRLVLGCLLDDSAVERVYFAPDGVLSGASAGSVLVEHGTFSPHLAVRIADAASARGGAFVDAPVTGGPEAAAAGSLVAMAGGDEAGAQRWMAMASSYLDAVHWVGGPGNGLRLKLVNQLLVSVHLAAAAEAAAMLDASGIDFDRALPVLSGGWASSAMLERGLSRALRGDLQATGATIAGLIDVQELVSATLRELGVDAHLFTAARERFDIANDAGHGEADPAALVELARSRLVVRGVESDG